MRNMILIVPMLFLWSCQSAHKIKPEIFPQKLPISSIKLTADDATQYSLADIFQEHKATVIIFWQSKCPCVKRYEERVNKLFDRYSFNGVAMMYVSSNMNESFRDAVDAYKKRKSALPLLRDENGQLAKLLGARGTPTAALFNQAGELVYLGWIDNEHDENEAGRIAYLENAIKDVLAGRYVETPTSPMFGCDIR